MIRRILLGVSDSPAALAAARFAVDLAAACSATVRVLHVLADGELAAALAGASSEPERWGADIVVLGRGDQPGDRQPYVGPQARRVLEFARDPVLLVPPP